MTTTTRRAAAALATLALAGGGGASLALAGTQSGIDPWEVALFKQRARSALVQAGPAARPTVSPDVLLAKRLPASGARVLSAPALRPQVSLDVLLARLRP